MKSVSLNFLFRKWANFFFLVDNLAFPIDSMHEDYNQEWLGRFGQLSSKEKAVLERYKLLKKSIWDKGGKDLLNRFEASFYQISELEPKDQPPEMTLVFETFKDRFQLMWKEYEPILSQNRKLVEEKFSLVQPDFNQSFSAIGRLYGVDKFSKSIEVYLMMRPDPGFRGGRMIGQKPPKVMVEGGALDIKNKKQVSHLWLLLLHELTHTCFENDGFFKLLNAYLNEKPPLAHFLEKYPATKTPVSATRRAMQEMIINAIEYSSYIRGRFDQNYQGSLKDGKALLKELKKMLEANGEKRRLILTGGRATYEYIAWKLERVTRSYLENEKRMDETFLDSIYNVLKEFPDNLLMDLKTFN